MRTRTIAIDAPDLGAYLDFLIEQERPILRIREQLAGRYFLVTFET